LAFYSFINLKPKAYIANPYIFPPKSCVLGCKKKDDGIGELYFQLDATILKKNKNKSSFFRTEVI
jgi:hypothetical protein